MYLCNSGLIVYLFDSTELAQFSLHHKTIVSSQCQRIFGGLNTGWLSYCILKVDGLAWGYELATEVFFPPFIFCSKKILLLIFLPHILIIKQF